MTSPAPSASDRSSSTGALRILVFGYMIRMPLGGLVWHYLQYALGLADLGHDVYYLEDSCFFEDDQQHWFHNPDTGVMGSDPAPGMRFIRNQLRGTPLDGKWALYRPRDDHWSGPASEAVPELCRTADLLLNVSAANPIREPFLQVPRRVFLDTDPAFSQVRILTCPYRSALAGRHTSFMTFGENIGKESCSSPTAGLSWTATRQPIVLAHWPVTPGPELGNFTTLLAWDSFRSEEYEGVRYGMKSESFQDVLDLPRRSPARFELSLFEPDAVPPEVGERGWCIHDGQAATRDPLRYQRYVRQSKAEFSVAKQGYVRSQCGWFSDRSATYLASGRPVILQDTGFSDVLPTGEGLLRYRNLEDATGAVAAVEGSYQLHCDAARDLAVEYFDSKKVLTDLIAKAG
jgi:hypothetical protein